MNPAIHAEVERLRPGREAFTAAEWKLIQRLNTPAKVQKYLSSLPYNREPGGPTLRSFRELIKSQQAHCLEGAVAAAAILEQHGYPPLLLDLESEDLLDHVLFVFKVNGGWGAVARSRDIGLHGRKPVFATPRALALSYVDEYVDFSGRITGYAVADLRSLGHYDWRLSSGNVWKVERMLLELPHRQIRTSDARVDRLRQRYREYRAKYGRKPVYYRRMDRWTELPKEFW